MATLLVVDDEPDVVTMVRVLLEREGHAVLTASDGEAGLAAAQESDPDLILLDIMMPGLDGLEVLERLKQEKNTADTPVIMLTARADYSAKAQAWEQYAHTYLTKPFDPNALVRSVRDAMGAPQEAGGSRSAESPR